MSLGTLLKVGKAMYDTVDKAAAKATGDENALSKGIDKAKTAVSNYVNRNKKDDMTFDLSQVKSTVTNPSQIFKGISVDDERKLYRIVEEMYPNGSQFEKNQAIQGLYASALKAQKQKDINVGRQNIILELQNLAENAKSGREKNTYNVKIKKSNLADLIKEQLSQDGYNVSNIMNLTDDGVISGFLQTNPQYQDAFNKFFYNDQDAITLGKELGWIEKDGWDKTGDILKGAAKGVAGWIPKFGEGIKDFLDLGDKEESGFLNFVEEKYGTAPANLTLKDLKKAKAEYEGTDKSQYQPNLATASTKTAEGLTDIIFTAGGPKAIWNTIKYGTDIGKVSNAGIRAINGANKTMAINNAFKGGMGAMSETPYLNKVPETMGEGLSRLGEWVNNQAPVLKDIRDSLPEKDRAEWDAFIGGNVLGLTKATTKGVKSGIGGAVDIIKNYDSNVTAELGKGNLKKAWNTIQDNITTNANNKLEQQRLKQAHKTSQSAYEQRGASANALDDLYEKGKLNNVKSLDDLLGFTDESIDTFKREQESIAQNKTYKNLTSKDLSIDTPTEVYSQKLGKKVTRPQTEQPFINLLDNIIEHYDKVDESKARTYKSYKAALESEGGLPAEIALEIKRHGNYLHQKDYNSKNGLLKDSDKSKKRDANIEKINKVVEGLNIGEELRSRDAKLSSYYTLKSSLEKLQKASEELEKKMDDSGWGKTIGKTINKSAFGTGGMGLKAVVSWLQSIAENLGLTSKVYDPVQLVNRIPKFVEDYVKLIDKMKNKPQESTSLLNKFYQNWKYLAEPYSDKEEEK